jgi:hypothetical protein
MRFATGRGTTTGRRDRLSFATLAIGDGFAAHFEFFRGGSPGFPRNLPWQAVNYK